MISAMRILEEFSAEALRESARVLRGGGVVVMPTDTVYGFTANALDEEAVGKIFKIKRRLEEKALPIFVSSLEMAKQYAVIDDGIVPFLERVWPGKVTVIFRQKNIETDGQKNRKTEKLKDLETEKLCLSPVGGEETIGIRIPDSPFIFRLFDEIDFPLAQTSANVAGEREAGGAEDILSFFEKSDLKPDLVIDGGKCFSLSSTVVDLTGDIPRVLREGVISNEEVERLFRESGLK